MRNCTASKCTPTQNGTLRQPNATPPQLRPKVKARSYQTQRCPFLNCPKISHIHSKMHLPILLAVIATCGCCLSSSFLVSMRSSNDGGSHLQRPKRRGDGRGALQCHHTNILLIIPSFQSRRTDGQRRVEGGGERISTVRLVRHHLCPANNTMSGPIIFPVIFLFVEWGFLFVGSSS